MNWRRRPDHTFIAHLMMAAVVVFSLLDYRAYHWGGFSAEEALETTDKPLHALAYFLICLTLAHGERARLKRLGYGLYVFMVGLAVEGLQFLTPYRESSLADAAANAGGIALALALIELICRKRRG